MNSLEVCRYEVCVLPHRVRSNSSGQGGSALAMILPANLAAGASGELLCNSFPSASFCGFRCHNASLWNNSLHHELSRSSPLDHDFLNTRFGPKQLGHVFIFALHGAEMDG